MSDTPIAEAKTHLTQLIQRAERGEAIRITRRGKPVAVLVSEAAYSSLCQGGEPPSFWERLQAMRAEPHFQPIDWTPEEIDAWRERQPPREFAWPE
ncbi:type II toxin-antitoxin system Phd/YefM family antitoxin [Halochromatium glycolicum]|uniref:Antitoxin n=1 Tax=Halochromatium glycolicum TaxID=85075 RepID=A0AAJ0U3M6_9GAMM|nr:type II toxin-antitoxin system Phd/YefM family antitoxin [Halochromatium glycolicum]MBK1704611.1 hypothetical protein [Halochromatium glycolicum]